jgi:ribonuclease E
LGTLRKIHHRVAEGDIAQMNVTLPRDVAMYLLNQKRDDLATLERRYSARIQIIVSEKLMPHQSEIETRTREITAPIAVVKPGEVAPAERMLPAGSTPTRSSTRRPSSGGVSSPRGIAPAARAGEEGDAAGQRARRRGGRGRRSEATEEVRVSIDGSSTPVAEASTPDVIDSAVSAAGAPLVERTAGEPSTGDIAPAETAAIVATPAGQATTLLATSDGYWIENIAPFVPVEGVAAAEAVASQSDQGPRRRRRGGRRGGRGRRTTGTTLTERREDTVSPVSDRGVTGTAEEPAVSVSGHDPTSAEPARSPARRRRRGGSGRRRPVHESSSSPQGSDSTPPAAVSAPAEPPAES